MSEKDKERNQEKERKRGADTRADAKATDKNGKEKPGGTEEPKKTKATAWDTFREYTVAILVCLVIALFVVTFIVHPMAVPTESMQTPEDMNLEIPKGSAETYGKYGLLVGDRLLVDKFSIMANHSSLCRWLSLNHSIQRGDVVVFKTPDPNNYLVPYVKRVIGLPGETIYIHENDVFLDDGLHGFRHLVEPYKYHGGQAPHSEMAPLKLPPGHYFMMGDNRDNSADSRVWGPVPASYIFGKPVMILWSFPDTKIVEDAFPDGRYRRGIHTITSFKDTLTLYLYRIIYFWKTRWSRMFHVIPRGNCYFES